VCKQETNLRRVWALCYKFQLPSSAFPVLIFIQEALCKWKKAYQRRNLLAQGPSGLGVGSLAGITQKWGVPGSMHGLASVSDEFLHIRSSQERSYQPIRDSNTIQSVLD
jgi:hypothetical protein